MEQNLLIDSDLSVGKNLDGGYDEIKIGNDDADDEFGINDDTNDDNEFWTVDYDIEDDDDW
jgi:hypothetical protein